MKIHYFVRTGILLALTNILHANTVIYGVGDSDNAVAGGYATSYTTWSVIGVDNTATSYTSAPIAGTVNGVAFTYTVTVAAAGTTTGNLGWTAPGDDSLAEQDSDFETGDGWSVTVGNIVENDPSLDVVFDGFIHFANNFNAFETEGATVNGVDYFRPNPGGPNWDLVDAPINGGANPNSDGDANGGTLTGISIGTTRVRAVDFQFSTVAANGLPPLGLEIASNGNDLTFTWDSQAGKVYDLLSSIDPEADGDPATWTVVANQEGIPAIPPSNTLTIPRPADLKRLYVIQERNAPPPPPLFFDDFESDMGWDKGVGASHTSNTAWELGPPDTNFVDGPESGANGSATCYGTDLDNNYEAGTEIWLRSPPINLTEATSATLSFWHIFDVNGAGDEIAVVRVLRSSDNSVLGEVETFNTFDLNLLDWSEFSEDLPAAALGETIRLEFHFTVDPGAGQFFPGWYIDDVAVTAE